MTPDTWLAQKFSGEFFSGQFEPLKKLVHELSLLPTNTKIITIAGTNGKGETARILSQALVERNKNVALWTSPHLVRVNERFIFNGEEITNEKLLEAFKTIEDLLKTHGEVSYFEFLFLCFLCSCKEQVLDFIIIEVGLGGRLDAANTLDADYALLTSISRDHQKFLGHRYEMILKEKLGVTRRERPLFSALEQKYLRQRTKLYCQQKGVIWQDLFESKTLVKADNFSKRNQALAKELLEHIFKEDIVLSDKARDYAKRGEIRVHESQVVFYSSHNPDGIRKLVHLLAQDKYNNFETVVLSFSERDYGDLSTMVRVLKSSFPGRKFYFYEFSHPKAISSQKLEQIKEEFKLEITDRQQIFKHIDFKTRQKILCTGSQYFFSDILLAFNS